MVNSIINYRLDLHISQFAQKKKCYVWCAKGANNGNKDVIHGQKNHGIAYCLIIMPYTTVSTGNVRDPNHPIPYRMHIYLKYIKTKYIHKLNETEVSKFKG